MPDRELTPYYRNIDQERSSELLINILIDEYTNWLVWNNGIDSAWVPACESMASIVDYIVSHQVSPIEAAEELEFDLGNPDDMVIIVAAWRYLRRIGFVYE